MQKLRIVTLRFGTARQKMALERWTNPKPQRRARWGLGPRYGVPSCRGKSAGVAKRPREPSPTRKPYSHDSLNGVTHHAVLPGGRESIREQLRGEAQLPRRRALHEGHAEQVPPLGVHVAEGVARRDGEVRLHLWRRARGSFGHSTTPQVTGPARVRPREKGRFVG
jgi:hypothetical protein